MFICTSISFLKPLGGKIYGSKKKIVVFQAHCWKLRIRFFQPLISYTIKALFQNRTTLHLRFFQHFIWYSFNIIFEILPTFNFRFVQWRSFLVRRSRRWRGHRDDREQVELVEFQPGTIYKFYYSQDESDQGVIMETNLPTKDVRLIKYKLTLLSNGLYSNRFVFTANNVWPVIHYLPILTFTYLDEASLIWHMIAYSLAGWRKFCLPKIALLREWKHLYIDKYVGKFLNK
jgi:hypothetical protein